jgi:hypothetical protein
VPETWKIRYFSFLGLPFFEIRLFWPFPDEIPKDLNIAPALSYNPREPRLVKRGARGKAKLE